MYCIKSQSTFSNSKGKTNRFIDILTLESKLLVSKLYRYLIMTQEEINLCLYESNGFYIIPEENQI